MLITLPALLAPDAVRQSRADLETVRWMDGGQTAGHVTAHVKANRQLAPDDAAGARIGAQECSRAGERARARVDSVAGR